MQRVDPAPIRDGSMMDLVSGIVSDAKDLVVAHVDAIRRESTESVHDLGDSLRNAAFAGAAMVVTLVAVSHAMAITLIAIGLAPWAAYWLVAVIAGGLAGALRLRSRAKAKQAKGQPKAALERATTDAAWVADRAEDVL